MNRKRWALRALLKASTPVFVGVILAWIAYERVLSQQANWFFGALAVVVAVLYGAVVLRYVRYLFRIDEVDGPFPSWVEASLPWVVVVVLLLFIATSAFSVFLFGPFSLVQLAPFVALVFLGLVFGVWFIGCFTGDVAEGALAQDRRRRQSFRFAYVFTLSTLVVLIFPVTNPWQPDVTGPISLIRGCVDAQRYLGVPTSIQCGDDDLMMVFDGTNGNVEKYVAGSMTVEASAPTPASAPVPASAPAASAPAASSTTIASQVGRVVDRAAKTKSERHGAASGATGTKSGNKPSKLASALGSQNAASAAAVASPVSSASVASPTSPVSTANTGKAAVSFPASGAGFRRRFGKHRGFIYEPSYPWLIVIGGTYGTASDLPTPGEDSSTTYDENSASKVSGTTAVSSASAVSNATAASTEKGLSDPPAVKSPYIRKAHQVIEGGFVLPYYIVLLSFLGASISLTRRIPELQKRSEPAYIGTDDEPNLDFRTVREAVVFQIMQLVTAPFVAMVAFYAIAPNSAASGIAVGFLSGFSSELVLLQIRGVVEGLFPKSVSRTAASSSRTGSIVGVVSYFEKAAGDGKAVSKPSPNTLVGLQDEDGKYKDTTEVNGRYAITNVPFGRHVINAASGGRSAKRIVTVAAAAETEVNLILTRPED
ncbi:hypothetical protein [Paraburkholderia sp. BCC1876]|uniref:hypothetical protein n=1 Tax=Paraburkholderia sp. BCC1876 TaxID=2676303 RepID=UPI001591355E|nr:hypothetical protein [Paraburkholderia sp. BCC1876]